MRLTIVLTVWILCALFEPATTTWEIPEQNDGVLSVTETTSTSVSFKWEFDHNFTDDIIHLVARYKPRIRIATPAILIWDSFLGHYIADYAHGPHESTYRWNFLSTFFEHGDRNTVYLAVNELDFPGTDYDFDMRRVERDPEGGNITLRAKITARTNAVVPNIHPKSGSGCFHVYEVDGSFRKVKIYWRGMYGNYELYLYEEGSNGQLKVVFAETGESYFGFTLLNITLERHIAILRSISDAGVSEAFSSVNIPPQSELVPPISVRWNYTKYFYEMKWAKPENVTVTNYTVFWIDTIDSKASVRIQDFVYLTKDTTSFLAEGTGYVDLGLSVNTATSSSGLYAARRNY